MLTGDWSDRVAELSGTSKKGFLETGRSGGSSKGERGGGGGGEVAELGEAARLRKGLFDARLSVKPLGRLPPYSPVGKHELLAGLFQDSCLTPSQVWGVIG
jgi:hypothetical protein